MILKTPDHDVFIDFDPVSFKSEVIKITSITDEISIAQERLDAIPKDPTDAELLEWAKINYPQVDYSVERQSLQDIIDKSKHLIEECNKQ